MQSNVNLHFRSFSVGEISPYHSSYERGCQEKTFPPAPREDAGVVTYIQPHLILKGVLVLAAFARRAFQRRCQPQLLIPTRRFHEAVALDAIRFRSYASEGLAKVPTTILCETRGLQLFWVIRGGIGLTRRLGAKLQHTKRLMSVSILSLEPEHRTNRLGHHRGRKTWEITWVLFDAQAACVFSCSASKRSSFFQSVKVMAAILRARVRRAISGFMPLASKAA